MEQDLFDELDRSLPLSKGRRRTILRELRDHLQDAQIDLQLAGTPPKQAASESLTRLGDPEEIAQGFVAAYRRPRRRHLGLALGLAGALLLGAYGAGATLASSPAKHAPSKPAMRHVSKPMVRSRAPQQASYPYADHLGSPKKTG